MKYLLDTNICIYIINRRPPRVLGRLAAEPISDVGISVVTLAELRYGVEKSAHRDQNDAALRQFLLPLQVLPFMERAAEEYGRIRLALEKKGRLIGSLDLMIAAHALGVDATLVTNNQREFARVPGLATENWTRA